MNCSQCGAPLEKGLKFCTQCGARIEKEEEPIDKVLNEMAVQQEEDKSKNNVMIQQEEQDVLHKETAGSLEEQLAGKEITRPIVKSRPRKKENQWSDNQAGQHRRDDDPKRHIAADRGYRWENRRGISGFAETLAAIITNPIGSGEELYLRLNTKMTLIYTTAIVLISACMSYLVFSVLASKAAEVFYNLFDYLFGYGTVQYILGELTVQVLFLSILANVLLIMYITLIVIVLYRILLKIDIEWVECVQLMMMPMVISFFGKVIILLAGLLSIKFALILCIILAIMVAVLSIIQFINRLGLSALTVYCMPPIYVLSSTACMALLVLIFKGYL